MVVGGSLCNLHFSLALIDPSFLVVFAILRSGKVAYMSVMNVFCEKFFSRRAWHKNRKSLYSRIGKK
jgi:hypothetical protein